MREAKGNMFQMDCDALCITTNGFTKTNGQAVMGRGCAKEAARLIPSLPEILGKAIKTNGNICQIVMTKGISLLVFPVKPVSKICEGNDYVSHMSFKPGDVIPGWACKADIEIIKQSAHQLVELTDKHGWQTVILPRPGCGAGELSWDQVKPVLEQILDDRFTCMTF